MAKEKNEFKLKDKKIKRPVFGGNTEQQPQPAENAHERLALRQRRSLIMFVAAVVTGAVIFIEGEFIWAWAHTLLRGIFSFTALYWPFLLLFLAVATMLDKPIPKLAMRASFVSALAVSINACVFIFGYDSGSERSLKEIYLSGAEYKGGGVLGYLVGIPFIKLFGVTPARILIVLIMLTLMVFAFNIPIKKLYSVMIHFLWKKCRQLWRFFKDKIAQRRQKKSEEEFFDSDSRQPDLDTYRPSEKGIILNGVPYEGEKDDDEEQKMPASPVMSENLFEDVPQYFSEDEEDAPDDTLDDVESEKRERARRRTEELPADNKGNIERFTIEVNLDKKKSREDEDDDIFADVFGDDFLDTVEQGYKPEAAKAAREISLKKDRMPADDESEKKNAEKKRKKSYVYPPTELLTEGKAANLNFERELRENAHKLIDTLDSFSVGAKIVGYCRGPSVTRYEIQPAPGVKISKITGLADDIALNLAAEGGVRMEAPIPGKPAIGVEIPNKTITSVTMRELFESEEFSKHKNKKLDCVIGKDVAGKIVMMDLAKMPHLLIAGTTGSGKSVCVNSILMSILFRSTPDEVKMILIDPKLVEFSKYKGIPHLLVPVVSDVKKAAGALGWAVTEMEDRYKELSLYNVKDIDSYNKMVEKNLATMSPEELEDRGEGEVVNGEYVPPKAVKKMPKIVIAIDELADLMMAAPGEVEDYICRLAQKARAAGMHLVIATQRPSVNVITGVIKANIPSRISLKVASYVDSKTILDTGGGEKLIGKGDMLYSPVGVPKPVRVQGGYSSDEDIEAVTDFIKNHSASSYDEDISEEIERISESVGVKGGGPKDSDFDDIDDSDPMLEEAIKAVVELGQASTSLLQRKLRLGYARAGRLIDTMEQMGIVGPHEGSKSRKVLMTQQEYIERKISGVAESHESSKHEA